MGRSSEASLYWGFIVPSDKLLDLLDCFLKHAETTGDTETKEDHSEETTQDNNSASIKGQGSQAPGEIAGAENKQTYRATSGEATELFDLVEQEMDKGGWYKKFSVLSTGDQEDDWAVGLAFVYGKEFGVEKRGYNDGGSFYGIGSRLLPEDVVENVTAEDVKKFQEAMHLAEIGLELPLKEEWIMSIRIH